MEDVLHQYQLPYDPQHPLLCFDERPCFLIEEAGAILPMSPGKAQRYHYEYKNLNRRIRSSGDCRAGRKVPPLLAKVGVNKTPSALQGGTQ
jgi:hypothetical protein